MESITIDYKSFKAGISSAQGVEDGGYSPLYGGHNLQEEKDGTLYPQGAATAPSSFTSELSGEPVLYVKSALYGIALDSAIGIVLDTARRIVEHTATSTMNWAETLSSTYFTIGQNGDESGVAFQTDIYIAGNDDIALIPIDALGQVGTDNSSWWSVTRGHGALISGKKNLVVVEDTLYCIVKNKIHIWDGTSSQEDAMTLPPDFYATAAIKHTNGRDLIVFGTVKEDPSESAAIAHRVYYINTVDLEFTDEIEINYEVHGAWNVGGTIYVTIGERVGIFNGTGIDPFYRLNLNLADNQSSDIRENAIWTHKGTKTDQGYLLLPDGNKILAIGNIGSGTIMWHPYDGYANIDVVHMVFNIGNKRIGLYGYTGADWTGTLKGYYFDLDDHDGAAKWAANKIRFNQKVWVRKIVIDHETLETGDDFTVSHVKEDGTEVEIRDVTYTKYGAQSETRIDCNIYTDVFQPLIEWTTGGVGIKKITIFYENGE